MQPYEALEQRLTEWTGQPHVAVCNSGTAALHLALEALQLPPGSDVICPEFTFVAVPRAVVMAGLKPVFVDCDENGLMSWPIWDSVIDGPTEAVIIVHTYGRQCQFPETWNSFAPSLRVIEDMAELHGVKPHKATDLACWSFYRNKVIAAEEGGCVAAQGPLLINRIRSLRSQGFSGGGDWVHEPRGCNYRMTNAQAEQVSKSLYVEELIVRQRRELEKLYEVYCPAKWKMPPRLSPWMYDIRVQGLTAGKQRAIVNELNLNGVPARCGFRPMTWQEEFKDCRTTGTKMAAVLSREMIYMSLQPGSVDEGKIEEAFKIVRRHVR